MMAKRAGEVLRDLAYWALSLAGCLLLLAITPLCGDLPYDTET